MPKIDERAEWQLRILSEYSNAGALVVEHPFGFWFTILAGILGAVAGASLASKAGQISSIAIVLVVIIVVLIASIELQSK